MDIKSLVGKTYTEAQDLVQRAGLTIRVTSKDGQKFMVTMDHHTNRVNVDVVDDIVTSARLG